MKIGILEKANQAAIKSEFSREKEMIEMALQDYKIQKWTTSMNLNDFFEEKEWCENVEEQEDGKIVITIKDSENEFIIDEDGNVNENKGISLSDDKIVMAVSENYTISANLANITGDISWTLSNDSIVNLNTQTGNEITITAISRGETILKAKCGEYESTCIITVKDSPNISISNVNRQEKTATVTLTITNRDIENEIINMCAYLKQEGQNDSEYVEIYNGTGTTEIAITNINYSTSYNLKIIAIDTDGVQGSTTRTIGTYCFIAGTTVLTENGLKNIEDLSIGDKVYTINTDTNQRELKEITYLFTGKTSETYKIKVEDTIIEATPKHQFYVIDKGWMRAYELQEGDLLEGKDGKYIEILSIEHKFYEQPINVYNMAVDTNHNYLITNYELLVHNATPSPT